MRSTVEYVLEPVDNHGDIIDPQHYGTFEAAYADRAAVLARFPDAVFVALAVVTLTYERGALVQREYSYRHHTMRDGALIHTDADGAALSR